MYNYTLDQKKDSGTYYYIIINYIILYYYKLRTVSQFTVEHFTQYERGTK